MGTINKLGNLAGLARVWSWAGRTKNPYDYGVALSVTLIFCAVLVVYPKVFADILLYGFTAFIVLMAALRLLAALITIDNECVDIARATHSDIIWPKFTILVPLYQEAHMVTGLMKHLSAIDYPKNRLDIVLITEKDDLPTCRAVLYQLRDPFRIFEVPPSAPRTKPKALNAAFASIPAAWRGDIITVYDAEDRPHPKQLKQAALKFTAEPDIAAVQAPLEYYNERENLLTALFSLEYAALFHVWNPALARLGLPFTLGGTSNHIRREVLERCGGWDAHNVTEDADLSFRISAMDRQHRKLKIGTITLPTQEEAVNNHKDWVAQRSRWIKGFLQTWRVHMRFQKSAPDGASLPLSTRMKNIFALQITVGATLLAAYLHVPSLIIMSAIYIADLCDVITLRWPAALLVIISTGYGAAILTAIIGTLRAGKPYLVKYAGLLPLYWLLYFLPALMAIYEIIVAPAHWRKTTHKGIPASRLSTNEEPYLEPIKTPLI